jgi:DNA-binding NarL/FixJ family response regulator
VITVLLADDQALIRSGLAAVLGREPDIEIVGEARTGKEAVADTIRLRPDVVLMDIRMPGTDGLSATEMITADPALKDVKVLVLTTFEADDYVVAALRAGASGFLGKGVDPAVLIDAIRVVASGDSLLSPRATSALIGRFLSRPSDGVRDAGDTPLDLLTEREREIVALVGHGLSNDEIAARLYLSPFTVKTHANRAMAKLEARDRAQLVVHAYQSGLVRAGTPPPD